MIVAVTGANGFVGKAVLADLARSGVTARPIVRRGSGIPGEVVIDSLEAHPVDPAVLSGVDVVVHLASRIAVRGESAVEADAGFARVNVDGTAHLVDAAIAAGAKRFVFVSSIKAVGESSRPGAPITSHTAPEPEDAYGRSKLAAERAVRERCDAAGMSWTIVRPPMVVGPREEGNFAALVRLVRSGVPLPLGSVRNRRSIIFVENLASAIVRACVADNAVARVLTIADQTLSTPDLIRAIARQLGRRARIIPFPVSAMRFTAKILGRQSAVDRLLGSLELDSRDSIAALDWSPPIDEDEAFRRSVQGVTA